MICRDMIAHRRRHRPPLPSFTPSAPWQGRSDSASRPASAATGRAANYKPQRGTCVLISVVLHSNEDSKNSCAAHSSSSYLSLSIACIIMGIFAKPHPFYPPDLRLDDFHAMTVPASTIFGVGTTPSHHAPSHHAPSHHAPSHHPPGMIIIIIIIIIRSLARPS